MANSSSDTIIAATDGGSDLETFIVDSQRAILSDDSSIVFNTKVCFCSTLKDFLASRTSIDIDDEDGTMHVVIHAFIEPPWKQVDHVSSGGTPLTFIRENNDKPTMTEGNDADTKKVSAVLNRLRDSPTIALKLIRREAIEELHSDYKNKLSSSHDPPAEDDHGGPSSGDIDVARRINELAVEWGFNNKTSAGNDRRPIVVCQNDRVLDMKDATTQFVQSRLAYEIKKNDDDIQLCVRSPSLATPISGVRSRGTGCTFCKVIAPGTIVDALGEGLFDSSG